MSADENPSCSSSKNSRWWGGKAELNWYVQQIEQIEKHVHPNQELHYLATCCPLSPTVLNRWFLQCVSRTCFMITTDRCRSSERDGHQSANRAIRHGSVMTVPGISGAVGLVIWGFATRIATAVVACAAASMLQCPCEDTRAV